MMRSMFSGVSGLRVHQTKMDVLAHNIANVNTVGYKASRVTFNEVFSQTLTGASAANDVTGRGGVNPMQIGLGANVATIDKLMGTGASQRTDRSLDMMIQNDGMFIVSDSSGTYFTRAGAFDVDVNGNMHMNGMKVMGWDTKLDTTLTPPEYKVVTGQVQPITIKDEKEVAPPATTTAIAFNGNLNPKDLQTKPRISTMEIYDSLGNWYALDVTFTQTGPSTYSVTPASDMYLNNNRTDATSKIPFTATGAFTLKFDSDGKPIAPTQVDLTMSGAGLTNPANAYLGDAPTGGKIKLDFSNMTQFGKDETTAAVYKSNGNSAGTLEDISVGSDGIIMGRYSNGATRPLWQIAVQKFKNPAGLEKVGSNLFVETANSGKFDGQGTVGILQGGVLEMANVDLAQEFTEMITTQRGFQANSRVITTSDDMLQELVNLKR